LTGEEVRAHAAGRTDAGVHALGQVASVTTRSALSCEVIGRALNALLPPDVAVSKVEDAPPGFHARFSALSRDYRYVVYNARTPAPLWRRYSYHVTSALDAARIDTALRSIVGEHDFAAFGQGMEDNESGARGHTVRRLLLARCRRVRAMLIFSFAANAFLRSMVRSLVGTALLIGRGQLESDAMRAILASRERATAGPSAPPHGLFLVRVHYGMDGRGVGAGCPALT
jgi:tRNA pseudouridine38-40 synthase